MSITQKINFKQQLFWATKDGEKKQNKTKINVCIQQVKTFSVSAKANGKESHKQHLVQKGNK